MTSYRCPPFAMTSEHHELRALPKSVSSTSGFDWSNRRGVCGDGLEFPDAGERRELALACLFRRHEIGDSDVGLLAGFFRDEIDLLSADQAGGDVITSANKVDGDDVFKDLVEACRLSGR